MKFNYLENNSYYRGFYSSTKQEEVSVTQLRHRLADIVKDYHTCPLILKEKKFLESFVNRSNHIELMEHFKTKYPERKSWFYLKIIQDILPRQKRTGSYICLKLRENIVRTTRRILTIYAEKETEKAYLKGLLGKYIYEEEQQDAIADHMEECRSSLMADW